MVYRRRPEIRSKDIAILGRSREVEIGSGLEIRLSDHVFAARMVRRGWKVCRISEDEG
jgi:hypothetical protein